MSKKNLITMDEYLTPKLTIGIGKYTISSLDKDRGFWIENPDGEGMQATEAELEELLGLFWLEKF